jgi:CRP-like cAMP-binding protein
MGTMNKNNETPNAACAACAASRIKGRKEVEPNVVAEFGLPKASKSYVRNETVFAEGDEFSGLYCLKSGLLALKKYNVDGTSAVVRVIQPGEVFGFRSFLTNTAHSSTAEALSPSNICFVQKTHLMNYVAETPGLHQALISQMGSELDGIQHLFMLTVTKTAPSRFAHFLLGMSSHLNPIENEITFELPIMKKDIASIIGIAVESLSRVINRFRDKGIIEEHNGHVTIKDRRALLSLCDDAQS